MSTTGTQTKTGDRGLILIPEFKLDLIVKVRRSAKPTNYPFWKFTQMHPEHERSGPTKFELRKLCLFNNQNYNRVSEETYLYIKDTILPSCLNLQDGNAIQRMGSLFLLRLFNGRDGCVPLWKSTVRNKRGDLFTPCLIKHNSAVVQVWDSHVGDWNFDCLTYCHQGVTLGPAIPELLNVA